MYDCLKFDYAYRGTEKKQIDAGVKTMTSIETKRENLYYHVSDMREIIRERYYFLWEVLLKKLNHNFH